MSEAGDDADKDFEPSQQRLDQARARGDIARSPDVAVAAGYAGLALAALAVGAPSLMSVGATGAVLLDQADGLSRLIFDGARAPVGGLLSRVASAISPFFALPAVAALLALAAQRNLLFTGANLMPRLSRISPLAAARQKFGPDGLFGFLKSLAKLVLIGAVVATFLTARAGEVMATLYLTPAMTTALLCRLIAEFLCLVVGVSGAIAAVDWLWQRHRHLQRNRMSRQEVIDEHRENEGDPHAKAQRRQRGMDIATNRMLGDVPTADVVIVNPTHYAVALKWDRAAGRAPVCVAKGVDEVAARIREAAAAAGVPVHRDPPTARTLHASVEIGAEIRPETYRAVAAAIRFAEAMRRRAKTR